MREKWDAWVPGPEVWRECMRVLKPGGHVLAFAGTRSMDLMCMSIRLAGFELRDSIGYANDGGEAPLMAWTYGNGYPKNLNVSKQLTKMEQPGNGGESEFGEDGLKVGDQWKGFGTALKPAWEPIILARRPLVGTVAENLLAWGTGAINIEGCKVAVDPTADASQMRTMQKSQRPSGTGWGMSTVNGGTATVVHADGRWPANVIHDGSPEVLAHFPETGGQSSAITGQEPSNKTSAVFGKFNSRMATNPRGDMGSAARFFYCAKASREDRNEGLPSSDIPAVSLGATMREREDADWAARNGNHHKTVKPTTLMRHLCRLVTPPGGVVLDMYMGSGSTGKAAVLEGFGFIGIDKEIKSVDIAHARIQYATLLAKSGKKVLKPSSERDPHTADLFGQAA